MNPVSDEDETTIMRCALLAIVNTMQEFHNDVLPLDEVYKNEDSMKFALVNCTCVWDLKKERIVLLKHQLQAACNIARTLTENATLFRNQLNSTRTLYHDILKENTDKEIQINHLKAENETVQAKYEHLNDFIQLGYKELQQNVGKLAVNLPVTKQLQEIIHNCVKCYSAYDNQREKCKLLEQKNRFLTSKLFILKRNLESISEELLQLRNSINKDQGEIVAKKSETACPIKPDHTQREVKKETSSPDFTSICNMDLNCHVRTVQQLLKNQDLMIKDMQALYRAFNKQ